jgi:hypothetical protein
MIAVAVAALVVAIGLSLRPPRLIAIAPGDFTPPTPVPRDDPPAKAYFSDHPDEGNPVF